MNNFMQNKNTGLSRQLSRHTKYLNMWIDKKDIAVSGISNASSY